jgi:hypothetical protein
MVPSSELITLSWNLLESHLIGTIQSYELDYEDPRIKVELKTGILIYIQFNNHSQYSYSMIFSHEEHDRCRFDNYDDRWGVKTRPHHFHPRFDKKGYFSPMKGIPKDDMPILADLIKNGKILNRDLQFS